MKTSRLSIAFLLAGLLVFGAVASGCQETPQAQPKPSVAVGTWIDSMKIAEKDHKLHAMKYRIDKIVRDQEEVSAAIDAYNLSGKGTLISPLDNDQLEFCVAEYRAYYPKKFPHSVFGITDVAVPFEVLSLSGGTIQVGDTVYQSLSTTWEIGDLPQGYDFHSGDTYHGKIVFVMVKGYSDYLLHELKSEKDESEDVYIKGE
jgi:hypothetical protein